MIARVPAGLSRPGLARNLPDGISSISHAAGELVLIPSPCCRQSVVRRRPRTYTRRSLQKLEAPTGHQTPKAFCTTKDKGHILRTLSLASLLRVAVAALLPAFVSLSTIPAHAQASAPAAAEPAASATVNLPAITPVPMAAPEAAPKKNGDAVDNPYGIEALWKGSDTIARSVLVLLGIMSVGSWYIMIVKLLEQSKMT